MNDDDKRWLKALPLLLTAAILLIFAAWSFYKGGDNTASIASFAAGLILLGSWLTTAVVEWHEGRARLRRHWDEH